MSVNPLLSEELFQFIWQHRLYNHQALKTTDGEAITVLHPGIPNHQDGPDFTAATISVGATRWSGNVELHLCSSDWYRHAHHHDPRYANIILHVVFCHDKPGLLFPAPCLELQQHIPKLLLQRYAALKLSAGFVPCHSQVARVSPLHWLSWQERLLAERWEHRMRRWTTLLQKNCNDWEELCYHLLAEGFGQPHNSGPMLDVVKHLPLTLLLRYRHHPAMVEALLFGQAGLLQATFSDDWPNALQRDYQWLKHKHNLIPVPAHSWKWLRIRPSAFPTVRLATFAALWIQRPRLFAALTEAGSLEEIKQLLFVQPSPYWKTHYRFGLEVDNAHGMGTQALNSIIINVVLPLRYFYGKMKASVYLQQQSLEWLGAMPAEENRVLARWKEAGVVANNAVASQGLLHLKKYYCDELRCLHCMVGVKLLGR
ncbi:DUF2851 family protein [Chitinophaga sp. Cy-1792]|uniref:DUF2851 family protein n=1 Tax=Chitinophaga sp. Cy-1792 TaxID=2608339 RepID=UPI00142422C6|nr:DUF2851 family protein [Chitinophaga sp. Cy-1792]NIG53569.1 DUF2851 family protein [Chitinophaga sp. Cy-1792]